MQKIAGIERETRARLVEVLRGTKRIFTIKETARILGMSNTATAKMMARWVEQGWLIRVRRDAYMAVPPEARSPDDVSEDPLIVASRVFDPCYLGGWTAAEQWGLTEQIFRTIMVITTRKLSIRRVKIRSSEFLIKTISQYRFLGIKNVWRDNSKISFSDPTKTIVDMLSDPALAGGSRMLFQMLKVYLSSKDYDSGLLLDYCAKMNNGAIYKRLGYLLEQSGSADTDLLNEIRKKMTTGNAKLDPAIPCKTLVTRWRLFIPQQWDEDSYD
jgi:predicted transcriptional regulator of viral defense system